MMAASVLTTAGVSGLTLALPTPRGSSDDAAEIAAPEGRILIRQDICFHIAEGRLRFVLDAVIEGLDDVFFEMRRTRMCMHHRLALCVAVLGISEAKHIHFDAGRHQSYHGVHVLRDTRRRVQGDRSPDRVDILLRDAVASQEVPGDIRAVDFEAMILAAV